MLSDKNRNAIRLLRSQLSAEGRLLAAVELLACDIGDDNDGQIVLYSDLMYDHSGKVVPFVIDDSE